MCVSYEFLTNVLKNLVRYSFNTVYNNGERYFDETGTHTVTAISM